MAKFLSSSVVEKEMGYTRVEFLNQFKSFARHFSETVNYTILDNIIIFHFNDNSNPDSALTIRFFAQADRSIGSLRIPRLSVQFTFNNYTEFEQKQFFKRFNLSFQRGGG